MHVHSPYQPYKIEVIDSPLQAKHLRQLFPYLYVQSILEIEEIGQQLVSEWAAVSRARLLNSQRQNRKP